MSIVTSILAGAIITLISILVTFFITTISNKDIFSKKIIESIRESMSLHLLISHKDSAVDLIKEHAKECEACQDIRNIKEDLLILKMGLKYLVENSGGNPKDIGL